MDLQRTTMKYCFIQKKSILDSLNFIKLHISKSFWLTKAVCQDCHSVDSSTKLKMLLNFLWQASIVNLKQGDTWHHLNTILTSICLKSICNTMNPSHRLKFIKVLLLNTESLLKGYRIFTSVLDMLE